MFEFSLTQKLHGKARALVSVPLVMLALAIVAVGCSLPKEEEKKNGFTFTNGDGKAELTGAPTFTPTTWVPIGTLDGTTATYTVSVPVDSDTASVWVAMVPDATSTGATPAFTSAIHSNVTNPSFTPGSAQSVSVPLVQIVTPNAAPAAGITFTAMVMVCSTTCTPTTATTGVSFAYFTVNGIYVKMDPNNAMSHVITGINGQTATSL